MVGILGFPRCFSCLLEGRSDFSVMWFFLNVLLHYLLAFDGFSRVNAIFFTSSEELEYPAFGDVILALHEDIKFMTDRLEQLNIDAIFGLTLAEANVAPLLSPNSSRFLNGKMLNNLTEIFQMCSKSRNYAKMKFLTDNDLRFAGFIDVLSGPQVWTHSITWTRGRLNPKTFANPPLYKAEAEMLIFSGTPQERESDSCLMELQTMKQRHHHCQVSDHCAEMLLKNDNSRGYPLTHRLLLIQTAIALNCEEHPETNFSRMIEDFCQIILADLMILESWDFPSVSRDLAMEQIALCGMEGFSEFANGHYTELVLKWPNSIGCYSATGFNENKYRRSRRSTNLMDYGCDNHASGVAAAALSLLLRALVENRAFYLTPIHAQ